jgi:hypothetical protein
VRGGCLRISVSHTRHEIFSIHVQSSKRAIACRYDRQFAVTVVQDFVDSKPDDVLLAQALASQSGDHFKFMADKGFPHDTHTETLKLLSLPSVNTSERITFILFLAARCLMSNKKVWHTEVTGLALVAAELHQNVRTNTNTNANTLHIHTGWHTSTFFNLNEHTNTRTHVHSGMCRR